MAEIDEENPAIRGLAWKNLGFEVPSNSFPTRFIRGGGPKKTILSQCTGVVREGELLYIMGASGGGKSSTLDSLALRVKAPVQGDVSVHGKPREAGLFREQAKYVEQKDHLFEVLTVEETLRCAAELQVSEKSLRNDRVENTIKRLGLEECRKTKIGGTFFRGISGGQRRRVAIGIELIAMPEILLCDEPTSGLDSTSALEVMTYLKQIAKDGVSVICTIHQPSQRVFDLCDKLLLLNKGKSLYSGPRQGGVEYFEATSGHKREKMSEPEYILEQINGQFNGEDIADKLYTTWEESDAKKALDADFVKFINVEQTKKLKLLSRRNSVHYKRGLPSQIAILAGRNAKDALRNPAVIYLRFAMYFALCFLIGVAWFRVEANANRIQDLLGALFFANAFLVFMSIAVLPVYINERAIVTKERLNGSYSVSAYMLGHFIVEVIMLAVLSLACTAVLYPMVNLNPSWTNALFWALTLFLSLLVAESVMILLAAVVPIFIVGIAAGAFLFGAFMVVMGYFVNTERIPWAIRWMRYIGLHTYSFAAMCINEFDGRIYAANTQSFPKFPNPVNGSEVITDLSFVFRNKWANIGILCAMVAVYRFCAFMWIRTFHNGKK